jgi:hypothetical protein
MGNVRKSSIFVLAAFLAVSALGQSRTQWRTAADISEGVRGSAIGSVTDVDEGRNRFTLVLDEDPSGRVTVEADAVTTQFNGFGGTINGSPEVFTGTAGFMNMRVGDRVDVRGTGRGRSAITADTITLLGRSVTAAQTGVGQTRTPDRISPPTTRGTTPTTSPDSMGRLEGVVRQINAEDGRMVIETGGRQMLTIRASSATPVYYRGDIYRINNLEIGDRVRIEPEGSATGTGEVRARAIDVLQSVQETQGTGVSGTRQIGNLIGRVTRVDRNANVVRVDTGRGEVRVDLSAAADTQGRRMNANEIQAGDQLDITGSYSGDVFVASTVRFANGPSGREPIGSTRPPSSMPIDLGIVTVYGTVTQSLNAAPQLVVRDTQNERTLRIYVADDFVVRTRTGTYSTADKLRENDAVVIKAYRDADGNYIAQTIRLR